MLSTITMATCHEYCLLLFWDFCYFSLTYTVYCIYCSLLIYIYKRISSKFLRQKLKNGFTAGDVRWRVHSVTPPDEHRLSDIEPCFVLKVTKLRKIALILLRKKIRSSGGDGCEVFFPKRYKGHHRCPLPSAGRGQAGRCDYMSADHGPTELEFRTTHWQCC